MHYPRRVGDGGLNAIDLSGETMTDSILLVHDDAAVLRAIGARFEEAGHEVIRELSIDAEPWAYVSVQGRALGPTPLAHVRLPAGQHRVVLENPDHKVTRTVAISIKNDQRTSVRVRLSDGKLLR